jgi:Ferritin-like
MAGSNAYIAPAGLFTRLSADHAGLVDLQAAAQLAMQVEFTTIPVYLSGLYSINARDNTAYQALRSVVVEEMFHFNQAANILVALGGQPKLTGKFAPAYPCYLPQANPDTTPFLGLYRASVDVFANVYSAIETPAAFGAPAQGDQYDTIGQLYEALRNGIKAYPGNPFEHTAPGARQRTDIYIGKFGGKAIHVTDKETALAGMEQIVKQGEGTVPATSPLDPLQQYGAYQHYGQRTDGTYGPILGTPYEMSHFSKFRHISLDKAAFPPTLPIVSNPEISHFTNPEAVKLAELFNTAYTQLLVALEDSFKIPSPGNPDPFFGAALDLMHQVMPNLANALMSTPAHVNGDASVGPNAAPTWRCLPSTAKLHAGLTTTEDSGLHGQTAQAIRMTLGGIQRTHGSADADARREHVAHALQAALKAIPKTLLPA